MTFSQLFRLALIVASTSLLPIAVYGQTATADPLLVVRNDLVKIVVNNEFQDTGRFALETIAGNPENPNDDNMPLIYGRPKPWTSYSTFLIDGQSYVFGGPTKKRAGKSGKYGKLVSQSIIDNKVVTVCQFDTLLITQSLALFNNPISAAKDAVLIEYQIENAGFAPRKVGARIMLDTMLGNNDGAPFRIGTDAIEAERLFSGGQILPFWQAFDDLASPNVVAQGILSSDDIELTKPERMGLVNWGTLADNPFEIPFERGRSFIREGENIPDTALALFWSETVIPAKGRRVIRTAYGLGGLSVSAGEMRLGLTAPAKMFGTQNSSYLVMGYVQNAGKLVARNSVATFDFPPGTEIVSGTNSVKLGDLRPGESRQIPITVRVTKVSPGTHNLVLKIDSETVKDNRLTREVQIVNPARIDVRLSVPKVVGDSGNLFFPVDATLRNNEAMPLTVVSATLILPPSAAVASFDIATKKIDFIPPNSSVTVNWMVKVAANSRDPIKSTVSVTGQEINPKTWAEVSAVTQVAPTYRLITHDVPSSNYGYCLIEFMNPLAAAVVQPALTFDPASVSIESIIFPTLLAQNTPERRGGAILFFPISTNALPQSIYIAKIRYKKIGADTSTMTLQIDGKTVESVPISPAISGGSQ